MEIFKVELQDCHLFLSLNDDVNRFNIRFWLFFWYVCVHVYVLSVNICMCFCVWRSESTWGIDSQVMSTLFSETGSLPA